MRTLLLPSRLIVTPWRDHNPSKAVVLGLVALMSMLALSAFGGIGLPASMFGLVLAGVASYWLWNVPVLRTAHDARYGVRLANGDREWRSPNGRLHRLGGPARILADGSTAWLVNGRGHRIGGPAVEEADGDQEWLVNGRRHRLDGPALIRDGAQFWYRHNRLDRIGGPAVIHADGQEEWWREDRLHRADGPALIRADGSTEWYAHGMRVPPRLILHAHEPEKGLASSMFGARVLG